MSFIKRLLSHALFLLLICSVSAQFNEEFIECGVIPTASEYHKEMPVYDAKLGKFVMMEVKATTSFSEVVVNSKGIMLGIRYPKHNIHRSYLYKSEDYGKNWKDISDFLPKEYGIRGVSTISKLIAIDSVFVVTDGLDAGYQKTLMRSINGESWEVLHNINGMVYYVGEREVYCSQKQHTNLLIAFNSGEALLSEDFGISFKESTLPERYDFGPSGSTSGMGYEKAFYWIDRKNKKLLRTEAWNKKYSVDKSIGPAKGYHIFHALKVNDRFYGVAKEEYSSSFSGSGPNRSLVFSEDQGESWSLIKDTQKIDVLHFADCTGVIYASTDYPTKVMLSKNRGQSWLQVSGLPEEPYLEFKIGADGHVYFYGEKRIYRSSKPICCSYGGETELETLPEHSDPCANLEMPELEARTISVPDEIGMKLKTDVFLEEGDYFCFTHKLAEVGPALSISIIHGDSTYLSEDFTLKNEDCNFPLDENYMQFYFLKEAGNYFVAKKNGHVFITRELPYVISNAKIDYYHLSYDQHRNRNCFNRCHKSEPQNSKLWFDGEEKGKLIPDYFIEECYHPNGEDYRYKGKDSLLKGSQCVYSKSNSELMNSELTLSLGTFDYGYKKDPENNFLHFILDVFPHIIHRKEDRNFNYLKTPDPNIIE